MDEDELFNPDYTEVHRVLDVSKLSDPNGGDDITHFLVKWKGLPYEEATWELQQDVDPVKVEHFYKFREPPEDAEVIIASKIHNINIIPAYFYNTFFVNRKRSICWMRILMDICCKLLAFNIFEMPFFEFCFDFFS